MGAAVGDTDGAAEGATVGESDGLAVGVTLGAVEGAALGERVADVPTKENNRNRTPRGEKQWRQENAFG